MNNNPYTEILGVFDGLVPQNTPFYFGEMLSGNSVLTNGLTLDSSNLKVSSELKGKLNKGDEVILVRDGKSFIIITKVVSI